MKEKIKYYFLDKHYYFAIILSMFLPTYIIYILNPFLNNGFLLMISFVFGTLSYFSAKKNSIHLYVSTLIGCIFGVFGFLAVYLYGLGKNPPANVPPQ